MNAQSFPVTVLVTRPDGFKETVRVGTAVRSGDGFNLVLGDLSIGAVADASAPARRSAAPTGDGGMIFPPYGRSKGQPIAGASTGDLEFYLSGCQRTLADAAKSRWHDKERVLMAAIEAELARQRGSGSTGSTGYDEDDGSGGFQAPDDVPPLTDDDIPF